jgi:DNA repair exonuclease SbcCD nuclease subunit
MFGTKERLSNDGSGHDGRRHVSNDQEAGTPPDETGQIQPVERRDDVITVVLTADNHLGYAGFGQHPRKREERQQRLRQAFQQATNFAVVQGVDLFIQAGDLFDTINPDERDRSFVAERLAQLKQAGVRTFALGGIDDTPGEQTGSAGNNEPPPQLSYAQLGALHYFPPTHNMHEQELEPVSVDIRGMRVGICGLGVLSGQEGDPMAFLRVQADIERATIPLLILHAPIEGFAAGSSLLDTRIQVSHNSIQKQSMFKYILAGYHHRYGRMRVGTSEVIVAGATQHVDFSAPDHAPGFVFLGLAADGIRWCNHITVDALPLQRLAIHAQELWSAETGVSPTDVILERLRPLCQPDTLIQLRLEGELTRGAYHQLDLNRIRRYGEEHCFALAIDDSALSLHAEHETASLDVSERFSPRVELVALADEWIENATDESERKALRITRDELLVAMDELKRKR